MKNGLLLLQSITSSALRSSPVRSGGSTCTAVFRRSWSAEQRAYSTSRKSSPIVHAGTGAAFLATLAMCGSGSALVMCSSSSNDAGDSHGATVVTTASSTAAARAAASITSKIKSIDEPDKTSEHNPLLPFPESSLRHDTYNGVTLDLTTILTTTTAATTTQQPPSINDADTFSTHLATALTIWTTEQRKGIWLKIPTTHSHLIAPATLDHGFDFQHAEAGYCVLTKWLPKNSLSRLPNGPTHQVGIGALVIHPTTGKMLAVQEKSGPAAKWKLWKMPTGLTDPGEDIATAAIRELKEETGLDCVFDRIICFRQSHGGLFNRSDMFFVCLCKLAPEQVERIKEGGEVELRPQEEEILMAEWMDLEEYAEQKVWRESPLYKEMNGAMIKAARVGIVLDGDVDGDCSDNGSGEEESHGFVAKNLPVGFGRPGRTNTIYVSSKL